MNNVILSGNLVTDPELRQAGDTSVCRMRIAVNRGYRGQDGRAPVDYFEVVAWRTLGENCARYLCKGSKALVQGELNTHSWSGSDGKKHYSTQIVARSVEFLNSPRSQAQDGNGYAGGGQADFAAGFEQVDCDELPF